MEKLAPVFGSLGFVALIIGCIMFIPLEALRKRRSLAKKLAIGGGVSFIAALVLDPTPPQTAVRAASPSSGAGDKRIAAVDSDDDAKRVFVSLYRDVLGIAKPCDEAFEPLGSAAKSGRTLEAYQAAKRGAEACGRASRLIREKETPAGLPGPAEEKTAEALRGCAGAYSLRQSGMEKAMLVADGEGRPSVLTGMEDDMKAGQLGVMMCVATFMDAAGKAGIDTKLLQ